MTLRFSQRSFEVGIDSLVEPAQRFAHGTRMGKVLNFVLKHTVDPVLGYAVDHIWKVKDGEGADKYD